MLYSEIKSALFKAFTASELLKSIVGSELFSLEIMKNFNSGNTLISFSKLYLNRCGFLGCKFVFSVTIGLLFICSLLYIKCKEFTLFQQTISRLVPAFH